MTNMTSWCKMCYGMSEEVNESTCNACLGFVTTGVSCPVCMSINQYNGFAAPDKCQACHREFPNITRIKESKTARVEYSIGDLC